MTRPLTSALLLAAFALAALPRRARPAGGSCPDAGAGQRRCQIHASRQRLRPDGRGQRPQAAAQRVGAGGPPPTLRSRCSSTTACARASVASWTVCAPLCEHWPPASRFWSVTCSMATSSRTQGFTRGPRARRLHRPSAGWTGRHERKPLRLPLRLRQELAQLRPTLLQQLSRPILASQGALHPHAHQRRRSL